MITMMGRVMQEQSMMIWMESELTPVVEMIIKKIRKFRAEDVTGYLEVYGHEMVS